MSELNLVYEALRIAFPNMEWSVYKSIFIESYYDNKMLVVASRWDDTTWDVWTAKGQFTSHDPVKAVTMAIESITSSKEV